MAPKVFVTGGTGYIGGSVLHTIVTAHPEYEVSALLRNVPDKFSTVYPNVKVVKGDYDSFEILAKAASEADIVVHCGDSDHEPSLKAIISGLLRRQTPGFLLHLSGTGLLADWHDESQLGILNPKVWSDIDDLEAISTLPDWTLHRNTEKLLWDTIHEHGDKIKIAIMCPPDIYGKGLGMVKTWSVFAPMFIGATKKVGNRVFYVGKGTNTRSWAHIEDVMQVYLKVVEAAAAGGHGATWGKEGYYFTGTQEVSHMEIAQATAKLLRKHGVIENEEPVEVSVETVDGLLYFPPFPKLGRYLFASNSRTRADRASKLFGYASTKPTLLQTLEDDILDELNRARKVEC